MPLAPDVILSNVAAFHAFDAALASGANVGAVASPFLARILYEPDRERRKREAAELAAALLFLFTGTVLPQAVAVGTRAAETILSRAAPPDGSNRVPAIERRQRAAQLRQRRTARTVIVEAAILSAVTRLRTAVDRFWLEPGSKTNQQKAAELRDKQTAMEAKLAAYRVELAESIRRGETRRPPRPKLELWPEMLADVASDIRSQGRRASAEEELARYALGGFDEYTWVTVNGPLACPDCQERAGVSGPMEYFLIIGLPRDGSTVCRDHCYCHLYPSDVVPAGFRITAETGINSTRFRAA